MFGKKKSNKIDIGAAQVSALHSYLQLREVIFGERFDPEAIVSHEPEFSVSKSGLFGDSLEKVRFTFESGGKRPIIYHILLERTLYEYGGPSHWTARGADVFAHYFTATAKFGTCTVLGVSGIQIDLEYTDERGGPKCWYIEGVSANHSIKVTPDQHKQIKNLCGPPLRKLLVEMNQLRSLAWRMFDNT